MAPATPNPFVVRGHHQRIVEKTDVIVEEPEREQSPADQQLDALAHAALRIAELEEAVSQRETAIAVVSHDLRNPLNSIVMSAEILKGFGWPEHGASSRALNRLMASAMRMRTMIDDLLDVTSIQANGLLPVFPRQANLADLCSAVVTELQAGNPNWRVETMILGDPNGTWDRERLLQTLSNVIGNSGQHGIDKVIRIVIDGSTDRQVKIAVSNKGAIPPSARRTLFKPFAVGRRERGSGGFGIGLFVAKHVIEAHHGSLEILSPGDEATTTVLITLPRHP